MKITQEGDYALRVILYLYQYGHGDRVEAKVIAEHENIPLRFLLKLLRKLVGAGIVKSYRGTGGGYAAGKPAAQVTVRQVLEAIEGPLYVNRCLYEPSHCNLNRADTCCIHKALENVQEKLLEGLGDITFARLLEDQGKPSDS